ncbi:YHS domain-containing protein [Nocardia cyriacigeorgica]|uniref:YHS domain-containing protein n=1 Tax=Nocardia cyriacigeorgica TaxID=135487 RepID=A0A6P1D6E9_9NOCA|nr:YHS domain-containing protein [Nocardia cyriacigeorgica]NEW41320.1 YHS domain-containing protein [Nocardia cyriacigeorgica]NEW46216.1 YHS domain-containing protein [Nocardia cyriacigeorgica]NEW52842.1 YHS domain-containing protein [Nocardia cyriacigeorgica]NEW58068.1 YHS domain-containing protein [Nocardia cyriacigeorgica]
MMTIDIFVSDPALAGERGNALAQLLLRTLTTEESAPEAVMDRAREFTHVLVHHPATWATGGPSPADAPRYLVRVTVPGSWVGPDFGQGIIPLITHTIAEFEGDPQRLLGAPHCVVQILGVREHSLGTFGRATDAAELTRLMTADYRPEDDTRDIPEGYAVDPTCGMTLEIATAPFTLTHEGETHVFCAPVCRKVFAEEHALA